MNTGVHQTTPKTVSAPGNSSRRSEALRQIIKEVWGYAATEAYLKLAGGISNVTDLSRWAVWECDQSADCSQHGC